MKFEIDPNELTTDQRAHVAAFITNWPHADGHLFDLDEEIELEAKRRRMVEDNLSEEQRLDAEQKRDLVDIPHMQAANLNVIFGTPTPTEDTKVDNLVPLDKEGLPWDSRIHSSSKATIADGSWKLRRGVDPTEVEKVKAQLKELMAVPTFVSVDDYTPTEVVQALGVPLPPAPVIVGVDLAAGSDTAVITQIPPAPKSHYLIDQQPASVTLTDLIGRMSAAIAAGKLTQASIAEICTNHGVSEFHLLSNRPDLLPLIDADMKAMGV